MRLDNLLQSFSSAQKLISRKPETPETSTSTSSQEQSSSSNPSSVIVNLSAQGSTKSQNEGQDKDILNSDLPDAIKQNLLQIRAIKRLIAKKEGELAQLKQGASQSEQSQSQIAALQTQIQGLNESLGFAMQQLAKTMRIFKLDKMQAIQTAQLMLKSVKNR